MKHFESYMHGKKDELSELGRKILPEEGNITRALKNQEVIGS